jgi:hypothetical protein
MTLVYWWEATPGDFEARGTVTLDGFANLAPDPNMEARGTVELSGRAWLIAEAAGADTFAASGTISLTGRARLALGNADPTLPPTDELGWTTPDAEVPDIQGLIVQVSGITIQRAQITDLTIELDLEGGPKSATLALNCPLGQQPKVGRDTLYVEYKGQVLFPNGRLENITVDVSTGTGYALTYAGPLVTLRDHKAYRTVFVDSDLQNWKTDQGPRTSPDTFEVASRTSGSAV